jgi:hypothetical protein
MTIDNLRQGYGVIRVEDTGDDKGIYDVDLPPNESVVFKSGEKKPNRDTPAHGMIEAEDLKEKGKLDAYAALTGDGLLLTDLRGNTHAVSYNSHSENKHVVNLKTKQRTFTASLGEDRKNALDLLKDL